MMTGETILSGAAFTCPDCKVEPVLGVYRSAAGHYIGTYCNCGPYSRESSYFGTRKDAEVALSGNASN